MKAGPSNFVWYELHTSDTAGAVAFYGNVMGWHAHEVGAPGRPYSLLGVGGSDVGGVLEKPASSFVGGARPGWIGYIGVDDVDAYVGRVEAAGGRLHRAAEEIPGVGIFAVVADPQGVPFVLFQAPKGRQAPSFAPGTPGSIGWHELHAVESAFAFYLGVFGWTKAEAIDMGPNGVYQTFAAGSFPIGGMMTRMDKSLSPFWLYYVNVDEIDAAASRGRSMGDRC